MLFTQLRTTSYRRMLGASQTSAPQDQRRYSKIAQQEVQRNPLPNRKGKGVAAVVICADPGEDEDENPTLPVAAITTLQ